MSSTEQIFEQTRQLGEVDPDRFSFLSGTYAFYDDAVSSSPTWVIAIENGMPRIFQVTKAVPGADCQVRIPERVLVDIVINGLNPNVALHEKRFSVAGDMSRILQLHLLFELMSLAQGPVRNADSQSDGTPRFVQ